MSPQLRRRIVLNDFIQQDNGEDVFVHFANITMDGFKTLNEGEKVEFEIVEGDKGLHASKVRRA